MCHGLLHDGPAHCFQHFLIKMKHTSKVASKYYIFFHIIPLFLKLRKTRKLSQVPGLIANTAYEYVRSVLFMSLLVGSLRAGMCVNNYPKKKMLISKIIPMFLVTGYMSAGSILLEDVSRRCEISYYVTAKAISSVYVGLQRLGGWSGGYEQDLVHVTLMSLVYYLYNHHPELLRLRQILEFIFGDDS
jgi:hypothetical protein